MHARGCRVSTGTFRHAIGARVHGSLQAMTTAGYVSDGPYHFCYRGHAGCAPNGAQIIYRNGLTETNCMGILLQDRSNMDRLKYCMALTIGGLN